MGNNIPLLKSDSRPEKDPLLNGSVKARILIVDDEVKNLKLLKAYLGVEDYDIITAGNGQDALLKVSQSPPDVILLDIMMPGISGYDVTRRIKQNKDTAGIPIILLTALSSEKDKSRGMDAGADEFLTKPINKTELIARLHSMIRLKRFQEQLCFRDQSKLLIDPSFDRSTLVNNRVPTILVVEDDDKDAFLLNKQLENEPYILKRVKTGESAVREALNEPIDLILLDIMLPGISGFDVCRRLKGDEQVSNIQIVVMTSLRDLDYRIQGTELGADDYLVKPVNSRELKARVQALLKKKRYIDKLHHRYEKALNHAISDGLTGVYNHAYFKRFFELEIKRSLRHKHPTSLLLLDLDNFKQINDRFGHLTGDRILIQVAHAISKKVRDTDFTARYGGEEFAVILPYSGIEESRDVAERIRRSISLEISVPGITSESQLVTTSIGAANCPADGQDVETIIRKADEMMYLAKQCGKNQVYTTADINVKSVHDG
jgi:two-component system cell cycle response regulator